MSLRFAVVTIPLLMLPLLPNPALACACCATAGQRLDETGPVSMALRELKLIKFRPAASLVQTEAFPDSVSGVKDPSDKAYNVQVDVSDAAVTFGVTSPSGKPGRIVLAMPKQIVRFEVDARTGYDDAGLGPDLYKEWRFENDADLSGIFAPGRKTSARFILHGRGNNCTSSVDFTSWTLEVDGSDTKFAFLGKMAVEASRPKPPKRSPEGGVFGPAR